MKRLIRISLFLSSSLVLVIALSIVSYTLVTGLPHLDKELFSIKYTSSNVSMLPSLINTIFVLILTLLITLPLSLGTAIFLTEYAKEGRIVRVVRVTIETLSGIPSIVYGLFGNIFFSSFLGLGYSLLSGSLTLSLMILPLLERTSEESIRGVPSSLREASLALGSTKIRTIFTVVLPSILPSLFSSLILSSGRIIGETACLIYTLGTATTLIKGIKDSGRTLSLHMYLLMNEGLHMDEAAATGAILLIVVLIINTISKIFMKKIGRNNG